jgi:hypothetical protein
MGIVKPRPKARGGWMALCLLTLVSGLPACQGPQPEQALREQLSQLQQRIEAKEISRAMTVLAEDFTGNDAMDRTAVHQLLRAQVLARREVGATLGPVAVTMQGQTATASFDVVLTSGDGGLLPETGAAYSVQTGWRADGDDWKLYTAAWQRKF